MDRSDYAIFSVIAVLTVGIGVITTKQLLGTFFAESARQAATTTVAMAWVTWWTLVIGFTIAGGVEAWTSTEQISDLHDGKLSVPSAW